MIATECDGVTFYENFPEEFSKGQKLDTKLDGFFSNSHTSSLKDIKVAMAKYCISKNENVIIGFKYGQRSLGFFDSIFSRDNVIWYGEGYVGHRK